MGATTAVVANYTVTDQHGATGTATLTITLTGTNDAPVAVACTRDAVHCVNQEICVFEISEQTQIECNASGQQLPRRFAA